MKSFSKIYSHTSNDKLETWNPAELDVELVVSPQDIQKEQILAIFSSEEQCNKREQEKGSESALRPKGAGSTVLSWQPAEMDVQPALVGNKEWVFIESTDDLYEELKPENLKEEFNPEEEVVTILRRARTQAEEIILEAQVAADKVILQAQDEIDLQKKEGYQQGWNDAHDEVRETLKAAHALAEGIREWQTSLMAQGEQILVEMLKEISQTMFGEGVNLDANALRINLNRIMENAQGLGDLNIFINPRDAKLLDPSWSEYQLLVSGNKVKIIPSERITPGGCIVKGSTGTVDARVEIQLAAIINTFEEIETSNE